MCKEAVNPVSTLPPCFCYSACAVCQHRFFRGAVECHFVRVLGLRLVGGGIRNYRSAIAVDRRRVCEMVRLHIGASGPRVSGGRGENGSGVRRVAGRLGLYQEREECTPRHGCSAVLAAMFTVRARRVSDWCPRFQESTANRGISRSGVDAAEGPTGVGRSAGIRSPGGRKFGLGEHFVGQSTTGGWWSVSARVSPGRHWATRA